MNRSDQKQNIANVVFTKVDNKLYELTEVLQNIMVHLLEQKIDYKWNMTQDEKKELSAKHLQEAVQKLRIKEQKILVDNIEIENWDIPILAEVFLQIAKNDFSYSEMVSILNLKEIRNTIKHKAKAMLEQEEGQQLDEQLKKIEAILMNFVQKNFACNQERQTNQKNKKQQNNRQTEAEKLENKMINLEKQRQIENKKMQQKKIQIEKNIVKKEREILIVQNQNQELLKNIEAQQIVIDNQNKQFAQNQQKKNNIIDQIDESLRKQQQQKDYLFHLNGAKRNAEQTKKSQLQEKISLDNQLSQMRQHVDQLKTQNRIKQNKCESLQQSIQISDNKIKNFELSIQNLHKQNKQMQMNQESFVEPNINFYELSQKYYKFQDNIKRQKNEYYKYALFLAEESKIFQENTQKTNLFLADQYFYLQRYQEAEKLYIQVLNENPLDKLVNQKLTKTRQKIKEQKKVCVIF